MVLTASPQIPGFVVAHQREQADDMKDQVFTIYSPGKLTVHLDQKGLRHPQPSFARTIAMAISVEPMP